jgi:putative Holliday junction resolvase
MPGKLLALDVGLARIGVATCDPLGLTVRPLTVIRRTTRRKDSAQLAQLARDEGATAIVCGLPLNMDGSEGEQAQSTRRWAMRLAHALRATLGEPLPIIFWDERLSTFAAVILRSYLDAQKSGDTQDFGRIELAEKQGQK